jgi:hypothetical protein
MMKKILLFIVAFFLILPFVNAESGSVTILDASTSNFNGTGAGGGTAYTLELLAFDHNDFNQITYLRATSDFYTFDLPAGSSKFYCGVVAGFPVQTAGNTCTGTFTFEQSTKTLQWWFDDTTYLNMSGTILGLVYNDSTITSHISNKLTTDGIAPDLTHIAGIYDGATGHIGYGTGGGIHYIDYTAVGRNTVTNTYNVTYSPLNSTATLFNVFINKSMTTQNDKVYVNGSSSQYFYETGAYNHLSFNTTKVYNDGIILNFVASSGNHAVVNVNLTNSGFPTPTPTPVINPSTHTGIIFDKSTYLLGETATVSYVIEPSFFNVGKVYEIEIIRPSGIFIPEFDLFTGLNPSGQLQYQFFSSGTYTATIYSCLLTCFGTSHPVTTNDKVSVTAQVNNPRPYITAPPQVVVGNGFTVNYSYDRNSTGIGDYGYISIKNQNGVIVSDLGNLTIDILPHNVTGVVHANGIYTLCLGNVIPSTPSKCVSINAVTGTKPIITNITTQYLNLTTSSYMFGDTLTGNYGISNTNWSIANTNLIWDIYNIDNQAETMYGHINYQQDSFNLIIVNQLGFYFDGILEVLPSNFISGNNAFRILMVNDTSTVVLANATFTLSTINTAGYGLSLSKNNVSVGEPFTIYVVAPSPVDLKISGLNTNQILDYKLNSTISIPMSFSTADNYQFTLFDVNGNAQRTAFLVVNAVPLPTPTPLQSEPIRTIFDGWVGLLGFGVTPLSKFFFAWLVTTIFVIGGFAMTQGKLFGGTLLGGGAWGWFMALGYLPTWFAIIVVLEIALMTRWFR